MTITIGIDIGSGAVKSVLFREDADGTVHWLAKRCERIRRRDPMTLAREGFDGVLADTAPGWELVLDTTRPDLPEPTRRFAGPEFVKTSADSERALQALDYHGASETSAAQYDLSTPLFEVLNDE